MKIHVTCLKCQATMAVSAENAGRKARCPKCRAAIVIPDAIPDKLQTAVVRSGGSPESARNHPPASATRKAAAVDRATQEQPRQRGKASPTRRRSASAEEDIWAQSLSSYTSPAIEEHEYEAYGIAPRERRGHNPYSSPGSGSRNESSEPPGMKIPLIMSAIGMGVALLFGAIGFAFPPAALFGAAIAGLIGVVLSMWGGMKIVMNAFEVGLMTGMLYLFFGPYAIYFLFSRWDINQNPFLINLLGTAVSITAVAVSFIGFRAG